MSFVFMIIVILPIFAGIGVTMIFSGVHFLVVALNTQAKTATLTTSTPQPCPA